MTAMPDAYGSLAEPNTLTIRRRLPGPIERVWAYLTDSDLRQQWLAAGVMDLTRGAAFELVWRNDTLTDPPGQRPEGFGAEHRMTCHITDAVAPQRLAFTWGRSEGVVITLAAEGEEVLLTLIHHRLPEDALLNVCAGWHAHLDVLASRVSGTAMAPFWDHWQGLKQDYSKRLGLKAA